MENNDQRPKKRPRTEEEETEFEYSEAKDGRTKKKVAEIAKDWPNSKFEFQYKDQKPTGKALCRETKCKQVGKLFTCEGGGCKISKDKSRSISTHFFHIFQFSNI